MDACVISSSSNLLIASRTCLKRPHCLGRKPPKFTILQRPWRHQASSFPSYPVGESSLPSPLTPSRSNMSILQLSIAGPSRNLWTSRCSYVRATTDNGPGGNFLVVSIRFPINRTGNAASTLGTWRALLIHHLPSIGCS